MNITIEFRIFKLVLVPNSCLNWHFFYFSSVKQKKWTQHIFYIILHIQISLVRSFSSNWEFWFFRPHLLKKVFPVKNWESEYHHWIMHIQSSLSTKFLLKLTILIFFLTRFPQKGFFWSKAEKVNITYFLLNSVYSD